MEFIQLSKIKIAYERQGKGAPILLIHGFPLDHESWGKFSELLLDSFDVIMPDLPGFGLSDIPLTDFSISEMASALAELLDCLNIQKAYITGHFMGG